MYFNGIIIAVLTFLMIGVFHPIVIKCEYYFTCKNGSPKILSTRMIQINNMEQLSGRSL